jgi:hypothetical protein
MPLSRIAARLAPRATTEMSVSLRESRPARQPPTAPAPKIQTFTTHEPPSVRTASVSETLPPPHPPVHRGNWSYLNDQKIGTPNVATMPNQISSGSPSFQ